MHNFLPKIYALFFLLLFVAYLAGSSGAVVYMHLSAGDDPQTNIGMMSSCDTGSGAAQSDGLSTSTDEAQAPGFSSLWSSCNTMYSLAGQPDRLLDDPGKKEIQAAIPSSKLSSQLFVFLEPDPPRWA